MLERKLNIAILCTVSLPIPPFRGYGGTQRGIYDLIQNMGKKGHKIHLFGPGDSNVSGLENVKLHSFIDRSLWIPENNLPIAVKREQTHEHYERSLERLKEINGSTGIDVINLRSDDLDLLEKMVDVFGEDKIVYSLHNARDPARIETIRKLGIQCVAHCRNHKEQHNNSDNIKEIIYGIDVDSYPFSSEILSETEDKLKLEILRCLKGRNEDYLITLGNIGKHKGQKTSISLAKEVGIPLIIAGTPQSRTDNKKQKYLEEEIRPYIDGRRIIYFGNADEEQKKELLKYARGFLFPSGYEDENWFEPFGRAPVEALSCGTPVVAYRKGSMPEIIFDAFNGFLFEDEEEAREQILNLGQINRKDCRRTAEVKFNSSRVAEEYEQLFYEMAEQRKSPSLAA